MQSLTDSSSGCTVSLTDVTKNQPSQYNITKGQSMLIILPYDENRDIIFNVYVNLQEHIKNIYVFTENNNYQKITNHLFNIDLFESFIDMIHEKYNSNGSHNTFTNHSLIILDCITYTYFTQTEKILNFVLNCDHYGMTLMIVANSYDNIPKIDYVCDHILINGTQYFNHLKKYYNANSCFNYDKYFEQYGNEILHISRSAVMAPHNSFNALKCYPVKKLDELNLKFIPSDNNINIMIRSMINKQTDHNIERLQFSIDSFRPMDEYPLCNIQSGDSILIIAPYSNNINILLNVYVSLQHDIENVYILTDDERSEDFNNDTMYYDYTYQKITDYVFGISSIYSLIKHLKTQCKLIKNTITIDSDATMTYNNIKSNLVILDCIGWPSNLLNSPKFMDLLLNGRHYNITLIMLTRLPIGITSDIRSNFNHILIDGSHDISTMKRIYDHYLGVIPTFAYVRDIQHQMKTCDIIHVVNKSNTKDKIKIYSMRNISDLTIHFNPCFPANKECILSKNIIDNVDFKDVLTRINKTINELIDLRTLIKGYVKAN